jgi:hypothetical protein
MFAGTLMFSCLNGKKNAPADAQLVTFDKFGGTNKFLPGMCSGACRLKKLWVHAHSYDRINALSNNDMSTVF